MDNPSFPDPGKQPDVSGPPKIDGMIGTPVPAAPRQTDAPQPLEEPEPPLTPKQWLMQNGVFLFLVVGGLVALYRWYGFDGVRGALLTIFGIGGIIFVHELGHFMVAKWCDVHVLTFSIGFGPAVPGCCFKRGETTYKLALLPLGGYVNMVGEGSETDEGEDYPRSFKNKSVGKRMAIISAGVVMNLILGAIIFIFVFRAQGIERMRPAIGHIDPGGVAWIDDVRSGWRIDRIGSNDHPTFDDLRVTVMLDSGGDGVDFEFHDPRRNIELEKKLAPRKGEMSPVIGVGGPSRLELVGNDSKKAFPAPTARGSAAAAARAIDLRSGDVVVAATDPDAPTSLKPLTDGLDELGRRMVRLVGEPMTLEVKRRDAASTQMVELAAAGFDWGDVLVGSSVPTAKGEFDPLRVVDLPDDPRFVDSGMRDPFELRDRMRKLAGRTVVVQVKRSGRPVNLLVPASYSTTTGLVMQMGKVAAVRKGSPAEDVGLRGQITDDVGDEISGVLIQDREGAGLLLGDAPKNLSPSSKRKIRPLDPVRLPFDLTDFADRHPGIKQVTLIVQRKTKENSTEGTALKPMVWDHSYDDNIESPLGWGSPMSVPQLGLAYWVNSYIQAVDSGPASRATKVTKGPDGVLLKSPSPLLKNDVIVKIRFWESSPGKSGWGPWYDLSAEPGKKTEDRWAYAADAIRAGAGRVIQVLVRRDDSDIKEPFELVLEEDRTRPMTERGLLLNPDTLMVKAETVWQALGWGVQYTTKNLGHMYQTLNSLVRGRVSTKTLQGPISIVSTTFTLANLDIYKWALMMGFLSINLAVVNFLPIPLLDGGHMVFLIYEKIRGKPASESVRNIAAYIGIALILALMVFVFVLDIQREKFF